MSGDPDDLLMSEPILRVAIHRMRDGRTRVQWHVGPPDGAPKLTDNEITLLAGTLNRLGLQVVKIKLEQVLKGVDDDIERSDAEHPDLPKIKTRSDIATVNMYG